MIRKEYPALDEVICWDKLPNGLTVAVVPRPGFSQKLAYFATDYGSLHRQFITDGAAGSCPEGTAHFLEHKLFDMPGGRDVTEEFAALGASPNAFTSYDMTAYYFSCTDRFEQALALLLEFVSTPWFIQESVDKEQGIIGQEIDMNLDNPDSRIFNNLMAAMYEKHPVREEILGDRQTIRRITPQTLHQVHRAFYQPSNMLLCVVGDVDPEQVLDITRKTLPEETGPAVSVTRKWQEEMSCPRDFVKEEMDVFMPTFQLGFKCEPLEKGREAARQEIIGDLAAEALFGESSELYLRLYEGEIIDSSFGGGFETIDGMALFTASGDSNDPQAVVDAILAKAAEIAKNGLDEKDFLRMKRSALGRRIRSLDSFDATCYRICAYYFSGFDYFHFPSVYRDITAADVCRFLEDSITKERMSLAVIYPNKEDIA